MFIDVPKGDAIFMRVSYIHIHTLYIYIRILNGKFYDYYNLQTKIVYVADIT